MAFYKQSISNIENSEISEIVEIIENKTCEKCGVDLNILKSKGGEVKCQKCGFLNSMTENNDA